LVKQGKKNKIALVGYTLADGGLERAFASLSEVLSASDFEVHVIILENKVAYAYYGTLVNLGMYSKFQKYFKLKKYLNKHQFDHIIDFRYRINPWMELAFLYYIYSGFKIIYTIHSSKLAHYLTSKKWVAKQIFIKVYKIVSVSVEMNNKIKKQYNFEEGVVIPNSISLNKVDSERTDSIIQFKYCIAIGRLVAMKQFDKLIEIYCNSDLPRNEIHLVILGNGEEQERLRIQILESSYSNYIHLLGFKENILLHCKEAMFLILTSQYEGFGMVILEALSVGTPAISFDCENGPSEMIVDERNGLLVENQNFEALKAAMNRMVNETPLYTTCKNNAKASIAKFSSENICKKWIDLLKNKTN
jgi:N-acetylgalactosamine-N,N'-diacetylbacillosaminyl-diphospho-undecaprenol 4-alpha-N-acetylgalactosaminyltransferase